MPGNHSWPPVNGVWSPLGFALIAGMRRQARAPAAIAARLASVASGG